MTNNPKNGGAISEKEAIHAFKNDAKEAYILIAEGKAAENPVVGVPKLSAGYARMLAIKTDGLPSDLKAALNDYRTSMGEFFALFKTEPETPEAVMARMKVMSDDLDLLEKLLELGEANVEASHKLNEVAKKYGIELRQP